jgi:hypothetical protein
MPYPTSGARESFRMEQLWKTSDLDEVDNKLASNKSPDDESPKEDGDKHHNQGI